MDYSTHSMPMVIYTIFASVQDYAFWSCTSKYSCWKQTLTDVRHLPFSPASTKIPFRTLRSVARRLKEVFSHSVVSDSATPWTVAHQVPLCMGFSRQEYWSGLPFPLPGDFADPGIKNRSPALQADSLSSEPPGKSQKLAG